MVPGKTRRSFDYARVHPLREAKPFASLAQDDGTPVRVGKSATVIDRRYIRKIT
jgi:hypothetical protein